MKVLEIITSKRDIYGNCYTGFIFTNNVGKSVKGFTGWGSGSNESYLPYAMYKDWGKAKKAVKVIRQELPIREFNRTVKDWPHCGCTNEQMIKFINNGLRKVKKA